MNGYDKFRKLCIERNVKPIDVSKKTGVSTATLSSWKAGKYTPKQDKLNKIAAFFGVRSNYFNDNNKYYVFRKVTRHPAKLSGVPKLSDFANVSKISLSDVAQNQIILDHLSKDEKELITMYREGKYSDIAALMVKKAAEGK